MKRVGEVSYKVALSLFLLNLHNVFYTSQLRKYIPDPFHVIQVDDVQVRENLIVEASPLRVEDREVKHLRVKEIVPVKVVRRGLAGGSITWELESQTGELYPTLFPSGDFRGKKFFMWGRVLTPQNLNNLLNQIIRVFI